MMIYSCVGNFAYFQKLPLFGRPGHVAVNHTAIIA